MLRTLRASLAVIATGASLFLVSPVQVASASTTPISVPPVCRTVPGSYPGATISVGGVTEHVASLTDINVCLYKYAVTTAGLPVPQLVSGCGAVCFKIDSPGGSASAAPYIEITFKSDGNSMGKTYTPPPVAVGYTEPICVSVGTPAPACTNAVINLAL